MTKLLFRVVYGPTVLIELQTCFISHDTPSSDSCFDPTMIQMLYLSDQA